MKELDYPFDAEYILKKKKSIKNQLLAENEGRVLKKRIAILGGQTTNDIKNIMELFLLKYGIMPEFYESDYNMFYQDGMFDNPELVTFAPDLIYICTCIRNINASEFPVMTDSKDDVTAKQDACFNRFVELWNHLAGKYHCTIIQNNFEYPYFRLMGNKDCSDFHGRVNFVASLNSRFNDYATANDNFYICDVNYISSCYGLDKWSDPCYWHMYKYAVAVPAIPYLSFNVANIIKSVYGKNKKAFNLDMDNTLWGGIVGEDGAENIEIGQETSVAQMYSEFQEYLKLHKQIGVLLTINSKNDEVNAMLGLARPDSVLHEDDFVIIKANWEPKSINLMQTASELILLPESFVFVDDNPAERAIISSQFPGTAIPEIDVAENYIRIIDRSGFFEITTFSSDDIKRNKMYQENAKRAQSQASFNNYDDYLRSLEMKCEIQSFVPMYMSRIAQLTNKSNQFNLTTRRYSQAEIEAASQDKSRITLYGKLYDKFGDNGVVSVIIGHIDGKKNVELHLELWLMSCRVLKRNIEFAMMDVLVEKAINIGIKTIFGYYYPTDKNAMVKNFYALLGFSKVNEDDEGNTVWKYDISGSYKKKQNVIEIISDKKGGEV